ncbi:MAG: TonB-dependent receptor, partial [Gammaproteobacteria bacterium]|nr:TonB-dependent receptor [Gammaproteobacteria bacterium]
MQSQVGGRGYIYLASVALVFSLVFGTASAQESSDTGALAQADPRELEVIIVTAQRREQAITDVPVSIAAFTEEMLIDAGVTSTEELVVLTPSITLNKHISPLQNTIRIRGVGTGVSVPTIESSVSMVVDGVVIDNQGVFFTDLIDIERIEVLRGPQSTLFGKNAAAGVLNIVTKAPSLEGIEGGIDASYNEYNDLKVRATLSGPIADNLAYRLTGIYVDEGDGVLKNVNPTGPKLDDLNTQGLRGKLLWMPEGDLEIMATLDYRNSEGPNNVRTPTQFESLAVQDLYGVGPVSFSNRRVNIDGGPLGRNDFESAEWGTSVEINLPFADGHTFTSITAYREWSLDAFLDIDGIGQQVTPAGFDDFVIVPGVGPVEPGRLALTGSSQVWNYLDTNQLSQEFRIASPTDQVFRYLAGLFYWQTDKDYDVNRVIRLCPLNTNVFPPPNFSDGDPGALTGACTVPPPNGVSIGGRNVYNVETTYFAAFGQIDWDFAEQWSLSAGLRIQQEDFDYRLTGLSALRGVDA